MCEIDEEMAKQKGRPASKGGKGDREFNLLLKALGICALLATAYPFFSKLEEFNKQNWETAKTAEKTFDRKALEVSLLELNYSGWRIHLDGNDLQVDEARRLMLRGGAKPQQFEVTKYGLDSSVFSVSLFHDYHDNAVNVDLSDVPLYLPKF